MTPSSGSNLKYEFDKDLKSFNTLRLPGCARQFACFNSLPELISLLHDARRQQLKVKVLGGGSNVLMPPRVEGLVLQSGMAGVTLLRQDQDSVWLKVDAGKYWHDWVLESLEYGHGIENLALIPGTVGATPIQNIGAYGVEVADVIDSVQGICFSSLQLMTLSNDDCRFGYRDSVFKRELSGDFIVTSVTFRLQKRFQPNVSYGPLASWAEQLPGFTAQQLIQQVCDIRSSKLPDPDKIANAGSFFKNPVVSAGQAAELKQRFESVPGYPQQDGSMKLAAGWLIEQAGWKGKTSGNITMHAQQALVLTTNGHATLDDVESAYKSVQKDVAGKFGVTLEPEPQLF